MSTPHLVVCVMGAWGHIRPMLAFLSRVIKLDRDAKRKYFITLITADAFMERVHQEWGRHFREDDDYEQSLRNVLRFRTLQPMTISQEEKASGDLGPLDEAISIERALEPTLQAIIDESNTPLPSAFLTELLFPSAPSILAALHKSNNFPSSHKISLLLWCPTSMNLIYDVLTRFPLDRALSGINDLMKKEGIKFGEAANKLLTSEEYINPNPIRLPDLPPINAYELYPQEPPYLVEFGVPFIGCIRLLALADALITSTSHVLEPKACAAVSALMKSRGQGHDFFAVGPLNVTDPDNRDTNSKSTQAAAMLKGELVQSEQGRTIESFLESILHRRGAKSLLYISFGSLFGPTEPPKFNAWLEVVREMNIPLILVAPPHFSAPPQLAASRDVLVCKWAPQQFILGHPATGAFLTHSGSGGTHEGLAAGGGVVMLSWPFAADQPIYAILTAQVLRVGYELQEVRRGYGLEKRLSNGGTKASGTVESVKAEARVVLGRVFGKDEVDDGRRLEEVRRRLRETWVEKEDIGASAIGDVRRFVERYLNQQPLLLNVHGIGLNGVCV